MKLCPKCQHPNPSKHDVCYYCMVAFWYQEHGTVNPCPRPLYTIAQTKRIVSVLLKNDQRKLDRKITMKKK